MCPDRMDVASFIDGAKIKGLIRHVPLLCGLVMIAEGVDLAGIGYAGPLISKSYNISPAGLGLIYAGTVIGSLIGAVIVGPLADRLGRRLVLICSALILGLCTCLTTTATTVPLLFVVRLTMGVGFGAAVPSVFALTADYIPVRIRALTLNAVTAGVAVGVVFAGLAAAFIIPALGWKPMMYLSGITSLCSALLLLLFLPESLSYSVRSRPYSPRSILLMRRLKQEQGIRPETLLVVTGVRGPVASPLELLTRQRIVASFSLFIVMSTVYLVQTFLSYWLPTILITSGASMKAAGLVSASSKLLSVCGALLIGLIMDRRGPWRVLPVVFVVSTAAIVTLGLSTSHAALALVLLIVSSALVDSSFGGVTALSAMSFPSHMRATATGWITGLARLFGGGGGAILGGALVAAHWTSGRTAFLLSTPLILGAAVLLIAFRFRGAASTSRDWASAAGSADIVPTAD